jgi:hypothetical protein
MKKKGNLLKSTVNCTDGWEEVSLINIVVDKKAKIEYEKEKDLTVRNVQKGKLL